MKKALFNDLFLYGTQFYRPPNPPAKDRKKDLENIKKLNFNTIKIFAEWNWINTFEGVNEFDELIEIIEEARRLEIFIDINTRLEQAPYWVEEKYPDSHYVDSRNRKIDLQARSNTPTGGWPGLCFDHPGARKEAGLFLKNCATKLGKYENVVIFDCWNEPHIEPVDPTGSYGIGDFLFCYCPYTIKSYQEWLKDNYKDINCVNDLWIKKYRNFSDIKPPRKLLDYVEMMEWRKFMTYSMAEKMKWRYKTLKENLPADKIVMSHSVSHGINTGFSLYGCDDYQFTEDLDMFGLSLFPIWANSDAFDVLLDIESTRNMSRGKKCLNTELQGGSAICAPTGFSRSRIPGRNHYRMWNFLGVAFGLKGIMYWHYRAEMLGHEAPGFGLVKRDGSFTERSDETSKICSFLNKYPKLFNEYKTSEAEVAIILNRDAYYLNFAAEGNENYSTNSLRGLHRFLASRNILSDILIEEQVKDALKKYKVLFLIAPFVISAETAEALKNYIENGGTVISDCAAGIFDKFGVSQETIPSCGLEKVFGLMQKELRQFDSKNREDVVADFWPDHHTVNEKPPVYFKGVGLLEGLSLKMSNFLESYTAETAEPVLMFENEVVGAVNCFGKGKAYILGTLNGLSLLQNDKNTEEIFLRILENEGIKPLESNGMIIKDFYSEELQTGALIIINPRNEMAGCSIEFGSSKKIQDYYGCDFEYSLENEILSLKIKQEDGCCFIYKK